LAGWVGRGNVEPRRGLGENGTVADRNIGPLTAALEGRCSIERELGAGGMATVYLAHLSVHLAVLPLRTPIILPSGGPPRCMVSGS